MQDVPPFAIGRLLKTAVVAEAHPDADLLTAFAEQSLADSERTLVIKHLALCGDCRDVVALALPETEIIAIPALSGIAHRGWLSWPVLRWGALAAGILAVTSVGVLQYSHRYQEKTVTSNLRPTDADSSASARTQSAGVQSEEAITATRETAKNQVPDPLIQHQEHVPIQGRATSSLDVVKAKNPVAAQAMSPPPFTAMLAPSSMPSQTLPSRESPSWTITASGILQRSFDGGKSWENVNPNGETASVGTSPTAGSAVGADQDGNNQSGAGQENRKRKTEAPLGVNPVFRAVAAMESDVWAGGSGAALYHTADGGNHWARIAPSDAGMSLTGDINSIQFSDPQHGNVATSTAELWTTSNAGLSWQKQH